MTSNIFDSAQSLIRYFLSYSREVLTFYMPVFYTFKYLQANDQQQIRAILKFWCILSCYLLISYFLAQILDDKIFPFFNIAVLVIINVPPYEFANKIYESTIGPIFRQNKQTLSSIENKLKELFDKNTETIKNKMKDSTSERMKGFVGEALMGAIKPNQSRRSSSDSDKFQDESNSENSKED